MNEVANVYFRSSRRFY